MFATNSTPSAVPPPQGLNRANDEVFQKLKANYLSEFNFKGIRVSATPLIPSVLRGQQTELPVLFQISVGQRSGADEKDLVRTPFNICLVLDTSGSMSGSRLDGCKTAINAIIGQLTPYDTLSLVTYSTTYETVFVDCNQSHSSHMLESVEKIKTTGSTNLHGGLELGVETLKRSISKDEAAQQKGMDKNKKATRKANRVFLFSDGLVNVGITSADAIMANVESWLKNTDIQISTFGIGDGYDEKLMTAIAKHANGDSFFIETVEDIEDLVAKGLRGVSNMVSPLATLTLRGLGDAVIKDIPGHDLTDTPGQVTVRNLRSNGLIQLVVNLDIRVPGLDEFSVHDMDDVVDSRNILGYSISLGEDEQTFVDLADCVGMKGTLAVNYTVDSSLVAKDKQHDDVVTYLTIKNASKIDKEVVEHLANNRTAEAIAAKKKVIAMFEGIESKDRRGFAQRLKGQAERLVQNLEASGNTRYAQQMCHQQQQEESDDDMGFGLFD
ncbi:Ca-activated chloride channel homolog [Entomortierella parvispora]|uniref:Ca-activated chloride channel homolog n=1 Tax=Entomortierella parvispora TaxID=205924 RepID=A0A9P3HBL5_9FUNG|nr:Ca-activated chloride channel homolog [Entomortierella parvispora]